MTDRKPRIPYAYQGVVSSVPAMLANGGFDVVRETMAVVVNRVSALLGQKAGRGQIERAGYGDGRQVLIRVAR